MGLPFQLYVERGVVFHIEIDRSNLLTRIPEEQIVIGGVVNAHVAVKFIYVRLCKGTGAMHAKSASARSLWASICGVLWLLSWVVSESIPVFNDILGLAVSNFIVCLAV